MVYGIQASGTAKADRGAEKARLRDADDGEAGTVDGDVPADGVGRGVHPAPPEAVADHDDWMTVDRHVVGRRQQAAGLRLLPQGLKYSPETSCTLPRIGASPPPGCSCMPLGLVAAKSSPALARREGVTHLEECRPRHIWP